MFRIRIRTSEFRDSENMEAETETFVSEAVRMNERENVQQIFALVEFQIIVNLRKIIDKLNAWILCGRLRILKTVKTASILTQYQEKWEETEA